MLIQVRTDNHIPNREALGDRIRANVEGALSREFGEQLRRVEVYLQDVNGHKGGIDKRCAIEAHLAGLQPVVVHEDGSDLDAVVDNAIEKLHRALERTVGRLADRRGRVSMSGEES